MREDWVECNLLDIVKIEYGKGLPTSKLIPDGYNVFGANGVIGKHSVYNTEYSEVLISCRGAASGKINLSPPKCFITNNSLILKRKSETLIDKLYLYYNLISVDKSNIITGSAQPQVTIDKAQYLKIYLSPLPEQRAIVKKLESLFSSLDAGVADLKKAQQQLKIYRQAVLKKAFENIKNEISLEEIKEDSLIGLVKSNAEQNATIGVPYIKMNNINMDGGTDIKNVVYVDASASEIEKYSLLKGDILINTRNSFELVGKSGIIKSDLNNYTFNNNLMRLRLKSGINPFFVFYQIIGPSMRKMMVAEKKATTSICALYQRDIFPLKAKMIENIEEQNEIVKQIESRLSVCDSIEQNIAAGLEKAEALRQSILKKAFEGNLLTAQELAECKLADDYEPASVLLERIKAEQTEIKAKPSKKKPRHSVAKSQ